MRILFILKKRELNKDSTDISKETGLFNSANFVHEMLLESSIDSKIVMVVDNNSIDREVHQFKPDIVIIEALWVVPEKFDILQKLHPKVKWIIRIHSDMPFMSQEGIAMDWIFDYIKHKNVIVSSNSPKMVKDIQLISNVIQKSGKIIPYLPNYYPINVIRQPKEIDYSKKTIDISCFGAIRPLKNQLIQAVAAIHFACKLDLKLHFHMNSGRLEASGLPVDHNIRSLFEHMDQSKYYITFHNWTSHDNFTKIIREMDIGMQLSFSETFNIVGADHVVAGIPFLGSNEIPWWTQGEISLNDTTNMVEWLENVYNNSKANVMLNQINLVKYSQESKKIWLDFLSE